MKHLLALGCASLLLASAESRAQDANSQLRPGVQPVSQTPFTPVSVLPLMELTPVDRNCARPGRKVGGYTRIVMNYSHDLAYDQANARIYSEEARNWLKRFFMGKAVTRLLSVKASLTSPEVSINTILTSISHSSNKKEGESWSSDFNSGRQLTPFFRIDPDSIINLELMLKLSASYDATITGDTLDLLKRAVALIAPKASLVTSLNQERFDQTSQFVDNAVSNLLKESIVERASNDYLASEWAGCDLLKIKLSSPMRNDITPNGKEPRDRLRKLGAWTISSSDVLLSVFTGTPWPADAQDIRFDLQARETEASKTNTACGGTPNSICNAFKDLDPQRVMGFKVDANVSVAQALSTDTGIVSAKDAFLKSDAAGRAEAAGRVCSLVADKAHALGFNRFDSAAIVWAYVRQSFSSAPDVGSVIRSPTNCVPLNAAKLIGLI